MRPCAWGCQEPQELEEAGRIPTSTPQNLQREHGSAITLALGTWPPGCGPIRLCGFELPSGRSPPSSQPQESTAQAGTTSDNVITG